MSHIFLFSNRFSHFQGNVWHLIEPLQSECKPCFLSIAPWLVFAVITSIESIWLPFQISCTSFLYSECHFELHIVRVRHQGGWIIIATSCQIWKDQGEHIFLMLLGDSHSWCGGEGISKKEEENLEAQLRGKNIERQSPGKRLHGTSPGDPQPVFHVGKKLFGGPSPSKKNWWPLSGGKSFFDFSSANPQIMNGSNYCQARLRS